MTQLIVVFRDFANAPKRNKFYVYGYKSTHKILIIYISTVSNAPKWHVSIHEKFYQQYACKFLYVINPFFNFGCNISKKEWVIQKKKISGLQ
jgi:hypothetical protein